MNGLDSIRSEILEAMNGLDSIRSEIEAFVSRENRSHADAWVREVTWVENERTLILHIGKPPSGDCFDRCDPRGLLATLTRPSALMIYFPDILGLKPFCFSEDDTLAPAADLANERLCPLQRHSVLATVAIVVQCVKRQTRVEPKLPSLGNSAQGDSRTLAAAEAVLAAIKDDPLGADFTLALFSMAISSYRRDTISTPFPKQLESKSGNRAYADVLSSLEGIPTVLEISTWTNAQPLLQLHPLAVLALHFVLVSLTTKLCTLRGEHGVRTAPPPGAGTFPSGAWGEKETSTADGMFGRGGGDGSEKVATHVRLGDCPSYTFEVVLPSDPVFDAKAKAESATLAYHGSSPENFHAILNSGLRVMSGSRLMKHGAAFGEGIYLSRSRAAAELFAGRGDGTGTTVWPRSAFGGRGNIGAGGSSKAPAIFRYRIVAECRVLKGEGVKKIDGMGDGESYLVVSDNSRVRVVGFLLFRDGPPTERVATPPVGARKRSVRSPPAQESLASGEVGRGISVSRECTLSPAGHQSEDGNEQEEPSGVSNKKLALLPLYVFFCVTLSLLGIYEGVRYFGGRS